MNSFGEIIAAFGGPAEFSRAIGIKPFHAQTMKTRGSIPPEYWERVVSAAVAREIDGVTFEGLAKLASTRRDASPIPSPATAEAAE